LSIGGETINSWRKVPAVIQKIQGNPTQLEVRRDGKIVALQITPVFDQSGAGGDAWRIGVELTSEYERIETQLGFFQALRESVDQNVKNATLIFKVLGGLIEQRMSPKSISGPIGIAQLSGQAARSGWPDLILLMAAISLNLGIFNLLPIPILDGGVITLLLLESVMQRDISVAVKERIVQVGLVFLMLLFAFVMYNDIVKSLPQS
jgi:regulator of sigma E protease